MATGKTCSTSIGPGNSNIRAPTPTNRTRTSHRNTVSLLLSRDEILLQEYEVKDIESSINFLEKSPFRQSGILFSLDSLIFTILHITQHTGIPRVVIKGLRAVALHLEDSSTRKSTIAEVDIQQITDSLSASLSNHVVSTLSSALSTHVVAAISPQVASILTTSETLKANVKEIAKLKTTLAENTTIGPGLGSEAASRAEQAAEAVLNSIMEVKTVMEGLTSPLKTALQTTPKLYSTIVQQNPQTPTPVSAALVRAVTRDHQVLFDPTPGQSLLAPEATSADIANKIKQALTTTQSNDRPELHVKATTRLRNGGFVIEFTTAEAATWVQHPENRLNIANALNNAVTIKDRCFSIIVPFLSVTSRVEDSAWLRTVEEENGLTPGVIESVNWIKPLQRRAVNQRVAHTIFHFTQPNMANKILRDGIYVGQEKLHPCIDAKHPENSMPYFPTDESWTQVLLPPQPVPTRKMTSSIPLSPPATAHPVLRQSNLPFELRRPVRYHQPRGAPRHFGRGGFRADTPTGPNSIPLVANAGSWDFNSSLPTIQRTPSLSRVPLTNHYSFLNLPKCQYTAPKSNPNPTLKASIIPEIPLAPTTCVFNMIDEEDEFFDCE
ncbi:uncharacterized protein EDB93DRAFT_1270994 [Suillus bovinus]|uniref:uncharacterized protein n=1 Tax=Suillus bovinus TaxID=48563 RepID=UPI001B86B6B6|nr:uncharacterized protein EDB93DRAFT_1270994 [Suillus bovinus]KAG2153438.1 hypothetical protein EDB93DRAFT_1270994 [Suillus bovinus]